ncbi:hypothetical protein DID88_008556 [Monilinia fructigena]|uniref:Uncharacterized protein n=1 Tax=Monilinia fructigena TaxID=38457 RepID=A0A395JAT9_9HELO|nr:hypothetical protein DID88_008556 [Monilinia fructigena]
MASNSTTSRRRRKNQLSFSTVNIGTSTSQGSGASLNSPSPLVLGYSGGKLVLTPITPPSNSSSKIEDQESPRSPTPRSSVPSLALPQAPVNHPSRALGDRSFLSPFAKPQSPSPLPPRPRPSPPSATMDNQPTTLAAQSEDVEFDALINLTEGEGTEVPAAAAREPLLITSSEFPANTGADEQQWRAAVHANNPSPNPFNLTLPDRAHRRSGSRAGSTIKGGSGQTATINSGSPSSEPAATLAMGPDLEVNFAEMMASLERYGSGDLTESAGAGVGEEAVDVSLVGISIDPRLETSTAATNYSIAEVAAVNTEISIG